MAQQDQTHKCSHSSSDYGVGSFGRSSKKAKEKKVPQRGLGVAQLEKIRIEEQQKKHAAVAAAAAAAILPSPSVSSSKSFYPPLPIPNFHNSNQSFPSGSPPDFRSPMSLQKVDVKLANNGGFEANWHAPPVPAQGNVPKLWNSYEFDFEKETSGVDPGLAFRSCISLPCEPNLPNWVQRTQQYQQPSLSMLNASSGTSSHYSIEPPSNQNYRGSCLLMQQEDKTIGMKRPYPFSLDVPPAPSFIFKLPNLAAPMKTNETTSCGIGSGFIFHAGNSTFREVPFSSASNSQPNSKKSNKESGNFNGDFLLLAPPSPISCPPPKFKPPSTFPAFHNHEYSPDFEYPSCQGNVEDQIPPLEFSRLNEQQQPFHSFFPPAAKAQIGQTTARMENCNGEAGENLDLNLKL